MAARRKLIIVSNRGPASFTRDEEGNRVTGRGVGLRAGFTPQCGIEGHAQRRRQGGIERMDEVDADVCTVQAE